MMKAPGSLDDRDDPSGVDDRGRSLGLQGNEEESSTFPSVGAMRVSPTSEGRASLSVDAMRVTSTTAEEYESGTQLDASRGDLLGDVSGEAAGLAESLRDSSGQHQVDVDSHSENPNEGMNTARGNTLENMTKILLETVQRILQDELERFEERVDEISTRQVQLENQLQPCVFHERGTWQDHRMGEQPHSSSWFRVSRSNRAVGEETDGRMLDQEFDPYYSLQQDERVIGGNVLPQQSMRRSHRLAGREQQSAPYQGDPLGSPYLHGPTLRNHRRNNQFERLNRYDDSRVSTIESLTDPRRFELPSSYPYRDETSSQHSFSSQLKDLKLIIPEHKHYSYVVSGYPKVTKTEFPTEFVKKCFREKITSDEALDLVTHFVQGDAHVALEAVRPSTWMEAVEILLSVGKAGQELAEAQQAFYRIRQKESQSTQEFITELNRATSARPGG